MESFWKSLCTDKQKTLLPHVFFNVVLNMDNLPECMTEADWNDLITDSVTENAKYNDTFSITVYLSKIHFRYRDGNLVSF